MIVSREKLPFNLSIKTDDATSNPLNEPSSANLFFQPVNIAIFEGYRLIIQTNDKLYTVRPCNKPSILVQYTIFFSGRKNKTKQNAAPLEVVYATSERFNEASRFIFAYLFILALTGSGYVQISQRKQKSCCIPLLLKISPLFKVKIGGFKNKSSEWKFN